MQLGVRAGSGGRLARPPQLPGGLPAGLAPIRAGAAAGGAPRRRGLLGAMATLARSKGPLWSLSPQIFQINIPNSSENCCCVNIFTASFVYFRAPQGGEKSRPQRSRSLALGASSRRCRSPRSPAGRRVSPVVSPHQRGAAGDTFPPGPSLSLLLAFVMPNEAIYPTCSCWRVTGDTPHARGVLGTPTAPQQVPLLPGDFQQLPSDYVCVGAAASAALARRERSGGSASAGAAQPGSPEPRSSRRLSRAGRQLGRAGKGPEQQTAGSGAQPRHRGLRGCCGRGARHPVRLRHPRTPMSAPRWLRGSLVPKMCHSSPKPERESPAGCCQPGRAPGAALSGTSCGAANSSALNQRRGSIAKAPEMNPNPIPLAM